jgi:ferric-dicitrate binding protein FerR (iron transport regulator)
MFSDNEKYKKLIIRVLQGEATTAEQQEAERWVNISDENRRLFDTYKDLLLLTFNNAHSYNADHAWNKVKERINNSTGTVASTKMHLFTGRIIRFALPAVAAMLLIAVGLFSLIKRTPEMIKYATSDKIAASQQLPDGSQFSLNTHSVIAYPEKFNHKTREVSLTGEAFFEVSHNPERPFIVHAQGMDIKVTGTSFNVKTMNDGEFVIVSVNTGNVLVYPSGSGENEALRTALSAGEKATYNNQNRTIVKGINDDLNLLSWKTGILIFRESRLTDVFKSLGKKYNVTFVINNPDIYNQRLTARFENDTLADVMESLSLIFGIKYEIKNKQVFLK